MMAAATCVNHFGRASRVNLDGDELCQECADAWVRAEGAHAAWMEAEEAAASNPPASVEGVG